MVEGLAQFQRKWGAIPSRARVAAIEAMEQGAQEVVNFMKANAPRDEGDLIDSIGWTWGDAPKNTMAVASAGSGDLFITIYAGGTPGTARTQARASGTRARDQKRSGSWSGGRADNAFYQEFGTQDMPANPFFFPAWRHLKRRVKSRLTRNVNKALKAL